MNSTHKTTRDIFFFIIFGLSIFGVIVLLWKIANILAMALIYAIMIYPLFRYLSKKLHLGDHTASILTLLGSFVTIIAPLFVIFNLLISELLQIRDSLNDLISGAPTNLSQIATEINNVISTIPGVSYNVTVVQVRDMAQELFKPVSSFIINQLLHSAYFVGDVFIFLFLVFFITPALPKLRKLAEKISP
ncbi:MAG: hypothetical protein ACMG6E_07255, partial [Candidatus Roizmanbacteria bacterium]